MARRLIDRPSTGPQPVATYSPAVRIESLVAVAGQAGIDPTTGVRVEGGIRAEVRQTRENIVAALTSCGCSMDDVLRVDVFLADLADFHAFNEEYGTWFADPYPTRTTVRADLLSELSVEIAVLAVRPGGDVNTGGR